MSLQNNLKKNIRSILSIPRNLKHQLHEKFPRILGHEVIGTPVQLYRHDSIFTTAISFQHFVHFFSNFDQMSVVIQLEAFDRMGKSLGTRDFTISKKGSKQILLSTLFNHLDQYGMFSAEMKVLNGYFSEISYLGSLHPQYMTLYLPQDQKSSVQMIHSHKLRQNFVPLTRSLIRSSSFIHSWENCAQAEIYFINSCRSKIHVKADFQSLQSPDKKIHIENEVPGYGVGFSAINRESFPDSIYGLEYTFDRNVDHKKPILFRKYIDGTWNCNHT